MKAARRSRRETARSYLGRWNSQGRADRLTLLQTLVDLLQIRKQHARSRVAHNREASMGRRRKGFLQQIRWQLERFDEGRGVDAVVRGFCTGAPAQDFARGFETTESPSSSAAGLGYLNVDVGVNQRDVGVHVDRAPAHGLDVLARYGPEVRARRPSVGNAQRASLKRRELKRRCSSTCWRNGVAS